MSDTTDPLQKNIGAEALMDAVLSADGQTTPSPLPPPPPPVISLESPPSPPPPAPQKKKSGRVVAVISTMLLLFLTLALGVHYVSQKRQLAEVRSRAASETQSALNPPSLSPAPSKDTVETNLLLPANITDRSFSVWWKTDALTVGCVTAVDASDKTNAQTSKKCTKGESYTHLVNLTELKPNTAYQVTVESGLEKIELSPFFGGKILTNPDDQKVGTMLTSGKIVYSDQTPVSGASVSVSPNFSDRFYFPAVTLTDDSGNFSLDVSVLDVQRPTELSAYLIRVLDKRGDELTQQVVNRRSPGEPLPTIVVNR